MSGLVGLSAIELAKRVRARKVTARAVTAAHLERFSAADPGLHAFQSLRAEAALREAAELDARPDLGDLPLAGVPVAIKDQVDVAGEPTRFGSAASSHQPRSEDSILVRRLRDAGCIVLGKTTVPELMIWPFTETDAFGITRNPWNRAHTPGGSSGGSAAAVAAGIVPIALGSDGGGSIRIPAAACGLFGIKPGPGVVPGGFGWYGNSEFGPLATTVADAAQMLAVLAGRPELARIEAPGRLRIALSQRSPSRGVRLHPDVQRGLDATAEALRDAGHQVIESAAPYPEGIALPFLRRFLAGIATESESMRFELLEPRTQAMVRIGRRWRRGLDPDADADAWHARADRWLSDYDLMLGPVVAGPAPKVGRWEGQGWIRTTLGITQWMAFTPPWNLARMPCAAVPAGISAEGLPVSVQLVGRRGGEALLLSVAAELERMRPWPRHAP